MVFETIIAEGPMQLGGEIAHSLVPDDYRGACKVVQDNLSDEVIVVLPSRQEAYRAARYAITPDGGYGSVRVTPAPDGRITCETFEAWAFG